MRHERFMKFWNTLEDIAFYVGVEYDKCFEGNTIN